MENSHNRRLLCQGKRGQVNMLAAGVVVILAVWYRWIRKKERKMLQEMKNE